MIEVKPKDVIVYYTTMNRTRTKEGTVIRVGEGLEADLIFVAGENGLTFAVSRESIAEIKS